MTLVLTNVTFDCTDVVRVATFWSAALEKPCAPDGNEFFMRIEGTPNWFFIKVPEPKTAKNRNHLDFHVDDRAAEVARLIQFGATQTGEHDEWGIHWAVMTDPEGNEFCVS
jgi:predicted enzyme related to lactoylglutathione lyase